MPANGWKQVEIAENKKHDKEEVQGQQIEEIKAKRFKIDPAAG